MPKSKKREGRGLLLTPFLFLLLIQTVTFYPQMFYTAGLLLFVDPPSQLLQGVRHGQELAFLMLITSSILELGAVILIFNAFGNRKNCKKLVIRTLSVLTVAGVLYGLAFWRIVSLVKTDGIWRLENALHVSEPDSETIPLKICLVFVFLTLLAFLPFLLASRPATIMTPGTEPTLRPQSP